MKKVLFAAVIVIATAAESYGFGLEPYAFTEHRDYTQHGKNIYSGAVEGVGVDLTLFNIGAASLTLNGKLYTGSLNARVTGVWAAHGVYPAPLTVLEDADMKINVNGWSAGANVSYPLGEGSLTVVPMLGLGYEREKIDEARPGALAGWDWYDLWESRALSCTTTDRLALRAGLGIGQQISKDWGIGAGVIFGLPIAGRSKSDSGTIKNRGYDAEIKAGASYKNWIVSVYYGYTKKNILARNDDRDPYRVSRYGVSLGYSF